MKHLLLLASLFMAFSQVSAQIAIEDLSDRLVFKDGGTIVARFPKNEIEAVTLISPANTSIRIERQGVFNGTGFAFTATSARVDTTAFVEVAGITYPNLSSPSDIKDWIVFAAGLSGASYGPGPSGSGSTYGDSLGWEFVLDSTFTEASPLTILAGDTTTWEFRGTSKINSHLPVGIDSFWDGTAHAFIPAKVGDGYDIRLDFVAETSQNGGFIELEIDIGPPQGVIVRRLVSFPKGSGFEHAFSVSFPVYTLNTFVANGGQIKIASLNGNTNMHSPGLFIKKDYHAR